VQAKKYFVVLKDNEFLVTSKFSYQKFIMESTISMQKWFLITLTTR